MSRALVLNATYEPLCVVSTRRALLLVLDDKAELIHDTGLSFHSERMVIPEPFPRSRGGAHTWDNVVAACRHCNTRKRDRLLDESGMRLHRKPIIPRARTWILVANGSMRADWEPYIGALSATLSA